ncbi:hypothetical protein V8C44DRAFT_118085 [Trichoderma aethiopicum]
MEEKRSFVSQHDLLRSKTWLTITHADFVAPQPPGGSTSNLQSNAQSHIFLFPLYQRNKTKRKKPNFFSSPISSAAWRQSTEITSVYPRRPESFHRTRELVQRGYRSPRNSWIRVAAPHSVGTPQRKQDMGGCLEGICPRLILRESEDCLDLIWLVMEDHRSAAKCFCNAPATLPYVRVSTWMASPYESGNTCTIAATSSRCHVSILSTHHQAALVNVSAAIESASAVSGLFSSARASNPPPLVPRLGSPPRARDPPARSERPGDETVCESENVQGSRLTRGRRDGLGHMGWSGPLIRRIGGDTMGSTRHFAG